MSVADLLRKHTNGLANVISYPNIIASALYSKEIISRTCLEEANNETKIASARAINLLVAVAKGLNSQPEKFQDFLDVLKAELPHVNVFLDQIQQEYDELEERSSVRHRHPSTNKEKNPEKEEDEKEEDEEDDVSTSAIIGVVIKGVGSIMVLSLLIWLVFLFIYKPPDNPFDDSQDTLKQGGGYSKPQCHHATLTAVYEELQTEISDSITLAIHFGLPKVERDIIDRERQSEKEKLIQVLSVCHDSNKCNCWEDVAFGLEKFGNVRKATEIRKKYIIKK